MRRYPRSLAHRSISSPPRRQNDDSETRLLAVLDPSKRYWSTLAKRQGELVSVVVPRRIAGRSQKPQFLRPEQLSVIEPPRRIRNRFRHYAGTLALLKDTRMMPKYFACKAGPIPLNSRYGDEADE